MSRKFMAVFVSCLAAVILLCGTTLAAEITIDVTDQTLWVPIESTITQAQKEGGWPKTDGTNIGWLAGGNILQIVDKVDFGGGLTDVNTTFSSNQLPGDILSKYPNVKLIIHIDSITGPIIAELNPDSAGIDTWGEAVEPAKKLITDAGKACTGLHSVFLERKNDDVKLEPGFNIWPITFVVKDAPKATTNVPVNTTAITSSSQPSALKTSTAINYNVTPSATKTSTNTNIPSLTGSNKNKLLVPILIVGVIVVAGAVSAFIIYKKKGKI